MVGSSPNQNEPEGEQVNTPAAGVNLHEPEGEQVNTAAAGVNLPRDVFFYIFSRLPVKTIGHCRCVCKHWQTLLSDPHFIHIQFNLNRHHQIKLVAGSESTSLFYLDLQETDNYDMVAVGKTLNFENTRYWIHGSYNGLLLLLDYKTSLLSIMNPITRESRLLPTLSSFTKIYHQGTLFGFGYCSYDDDYKVVVISRKSDSSSPVHVLKRNYWKRVEDSTARFRFSRGVFVNGYIHWPVVRISDNAEMIYAFDLAGEKFVEVEQPLGLETEDLCVLDVLGGCLCLIVKSWDFGSEIWVMKEYGVRDSWTKYSAFTLMKNGYFRPFFWDGDEFIVGVDGYDPGLALCSLKEESSWVIPIVGEQSSLLHYRRYLWTFADSLFSPYRRNVVEEQNQVPVQ